MSLVSSRLIKPLILSLLCIYGCKALGLPLQHAVLLGTIPFLLGVLNLLTGPAYAFAALAFVSGIVNMVHPWTDQAQMIAEPLLQTMQATVVR